MQYHQLLILLFIGLGGNFSLQAQCPDGNIILNAQDQIDAFAQTYPNCTELKGSLFLRQEPNAEVPILNLNGLQPITRIAGSLSIENTVLANLAGLEKLQDIGGTLNVTGNNNLLSVVGLDSLSRIGEDFSFFENTQLESLNNLAALTQVGREFVLFGNPLLPNLEGLQNLTTIGGEFALVLNASLSNLDGLLGVSTLGGSITLDGNESLVSITGLANISEIQGAEIRNNRVLSNCRITALCAYVLGGQSAFIANNAVGCSSLDEVATACDSSPPCPTDMPEIRVLNSNRCANNPIEFQASIRDAVSYTWNYGDGTSDTGLSSFPNNINTGLATHVYEASGNYEIELYVNRGNGCIEIVRDEIVIISSVADFTYTVVGTTVFLEADTTNASNITNFLWSFGDGASGSGLTPTNRYTYASSGTYIVGLSTEGDCVSVPVSKSITIEVVSPENTIETCLDGLDNDLDGLIDDDDEDCLCVLHAMEEYCCVDFGVEFIATNDLNNTGTGSIHLFPSGGSTDLGNYEVFGENFVVDAVVDSLEGGILVPNLFAGTYMLEVYDLSSICFELLTITIDNVDCQSFNIDIDETENTCNNITYTATPTNGKEPYQYNWTTDGENTDSIFIANPELHIGTQVVTITDANGCRATQFFTVVPGAAFQSEFTYELTADSIILTDNSTGNIINKQWTFNTPEPILNNQVALPPAGNYQICLVVVNECNLQSTSCETITIGTICPEGDVLLKSDADVLTFINDYPNCTEIAGNLLLNNPALTSVESLTQLTSIGGELRIDRTALTDFRGLENITQVGGVFITFNDALVDVSHLYSLTTIEGGMGVLGNTILTSISGFEQLTTLESTISIVQHSALTSIEGFSNLKNIGGLQLIENLNLVHIDGFSNLTTIDNQIEIRDNTFLGICDLEVICQHIAAEKQTTIANNALNCNSIEEVTAACMPPTGGAGSPPTFLPSYPWLATLVDFGDCGNTRITVFESKGYEYLWVETENSSIIYNARGVTYCFNFPNFNCFEYYTIDRAISVWNCGDIIVMDADNDGVLSDVDPDDMDACNPDDSAPSCNETNPPTGPPTFLSDYSWLSDLVDFENCDNSSITIFKSKGYDYLLVETAETSIMYNTGGQRYCTNTATYDCHEYYTIDEIIETWSCGTAPILEIDKDQDGVLANDDPDDNNPCVPDITVATCDPVSPQIFEDYPFLVAEGLVDPNACTNDSVLVYESSGYTYIWVNQEESSIIYNARGTRYCTNLPNFDCFEYYSIDKEISRWSCGTTIKDIDQDGIASDTDPDDTNPCIPDDSSDACQTGGNAPQIFEDYPWLLDQVNPFACSGEIVTVYQSGTYIYLYVEAADSYIMYTAAGQQYCTGSPTYICPELYGFTNIIGSWTCGATIIDADNDGTLSDVDPDDSDPCVPSTTVTACLSGGAEPPVFTDYPWLTDFIDPFDCSGGTIQVYRSSGYIYVLVTTDNSSILYNATGTRYCESSTGYNCQDFYEVQEVITEWNCGDNAIDADRDGVPSDIDPDDTDPCTPNDTNAACTSGGELPMLFDTYSWLVDLVDPFTCTNEQITVYAQGIYRYLNVVTPTSTILYNARGGVHCTSGPGYDCVALYNLTEIVDTWACVETEVTVAPSSIPPAATRNHFDKAVSTAPKDFTIYPNPSKGLFFVTFKDTSALEQTVRVLTLQGQVLQTRVVTASTEPVTLDVNEQAAGVYLVQVVSKEGSQTKRVVIE